VAAAIGWGALAASTLLIGALLAYHFTLGRTLIAWVMALGTGLLLDPASGFSGALVQAFAAGALLAMVTDTLLPEAYEVEGVLTGPLVVFGLAVSLALSAL
jgi:ZIP family zinc transporter